jgi:TonB family protein
MNTRKSSALLAAGALLAASAGQADFQTALKDYNAGRYDAAHGEFLTLAELGDCPSQFNLGAMALKGQGGPPDPASGVGWLQVAADNGCQQLVGNRLTPLAAKLSPDETRAAAQIVGRYGREALRAAGVIDPDFSCHDIIPASVLLAPQPEYPPREQAARREGMVIAAVSIGVDGHARDPEILLAIPEEGFTASAVEAWLYTRFEPAKRNGQALSSRLLLKQAYALTGEGALADLEALRTARPAAQAGDAAAAYLVGLSGTLDPSLGVSYARASQLLFGAARDGGPQAQYWIGSQLRASALCHPRADGTIWLRHAADGGSASAQLALASDLLGAGQAAQARVLLQQAARSDSYYVRKHVAALLAASSEQGVRDAATARSVALKLAAGEIQSDPQMFEVVAAAYAASGEFREAAASQRLAIQKAQKLDWDTRAMSERLSDYAGGKPWSGDLFASP